MTLDLSMRIGLNVDRRRRLKRSIGSKESFVSKEGFAHAVRRIVRRALGIISPLRFKEATLRVDWSLRLCLTRAEARTNQHERNDDDRSFQEITIHVGAPEA